MRSTDIFTERVNKLMKMLSLSKKDMAKLLNVDYSTFWRKLNGKRNVDIPVLIQIAGILGTSVAYLVGETDNPERGRGLPEQEIHLQVQNEHSEAMPANYAYWGGVVDEAHKVAERGNTTEITYIESLLKLAHDTVLNSRERLERENRICNTEGAVVAQMPVYGGHHNSNRMTVKTA